MYIERETVNNYVHEINASSLYGYRCWDASGMFGWNGNIFIHDSSSLNW